MLAAYICIKMREINQFIIEKICAMRPSPSKTLDQVHMRPESVVKQLDHLKSYVPGKEVVLLGDDDFLSMPIAMFLEPESVAVFDIDPRILNTLKDLNWRYGLNLKINFYNALTGVPSEHRQKYNFFITNPPYSKNNGASGCFFINRCLQFCQDSASGCIIVPNDEKIPWSLEAMLNVQEFLNRMGCIIKDARHSIHYYNHEDENLTSSSFIVARIKNTGYVPDFGGVNPYSSQATPFRNQNLYKLPVLKQLK